MLKIGITGGIGSGKTTVSKIFNILGVPVYNADTQAQKLMITEPLLIGEIKNAFGENAYLETGALNRKYISDIVFNDTNQLKVLNNIVHPAVFNNFFEWCNLQNTPYVLKEAALLFETNFYKNNNYNILVSAPLQMRILNVIKRDNVSPQKVQSIINKQMPEENKELLANFVIHNNEESFLINQVLKLHTHFISIAK
ncbi:MAG: dephospho-CoA kinase [Sphingobacteriales bacterium]|nr:MAG: dephospho-CoA kinase [Sphingobacteriales bacterium]